MPPTGQSHWCSLNRYSFWVDFKVFDACGRSLREFAVGGDSLPSIPLAPSHSVHNRSGRMTKHGRATTHTWLSSSVRCYDVVFCLFNSVFPFHLKRGFTASGLFLCAYIYILRVSYMGQDKWVPVTTAWGRRYGPDEGHGL